MRRLYFCCLVLLSILPACIGAIDSGPGLKESSFRFTEAMRWRDFSGAALFVDPVAQTEFFLRFPQDNDDLQIVGSRIESVEVNDEQKTAEIGYLLEYYRLPSSRVKKWRWRQQWRQYREKRSDPGLWMIQNAPPSWQ